LKAAPFRLRSADGVELFVHAFLPDAASPRAVLQIVHGMGEHAGRYERFAREACDSGWAVYAGDCRGHGQTAAAPGELGHFADADGWERVVADVHAVRERAAASHPRVPYALLGHSMGSFIAADYLTRHGSGVAAAVLSGSAASTGLLGWGLRAVARAECLRLGERARSPLLQKLVFGRFNQAFEPARTPFDWLSRDADEVARYVADPRCGFVLSARSFVDMARGLARYQQREVLARIPHRLPLYLVAGELDPVGGREGVTKLAAELRAAGLERVEVRIHAHARHEMLNETNRAEVTREVLGWLDAALRESA
jgi:alpha-beta hydrolase superfamily lysophospholipase